MKSSSDDKVKVLFLGSNTRLYGAERCLLEVASRLHPDRFRPIVVVPDEGELFQRLKGLGIDVRKMELGVLRNRAELLSPVLLRRLLSHIPATFRLASLIKKEGVKIVHSNTSAIFVGALAARITGCPHLWHVREIIRRPKILRALLRILLPFFSFRVVCISNAVKENFKPFFQSQDKKFQIIYDGVEPNLFAPPNRQDSSSHDKLRVGMVARINPWKGHETFLRASGLVAKRLSDIEFYVVGDSLKVYDPIRARLVNLIKTLGIDRQVFFTGFLEYEGVAKLIRSFDVFVLPSESPEPLGIVILEAMAAGKPVVATGHGGPLDIVVPGVTGFLVPPGDPKKMAEGICSLLLDNEKRSKMGGAGLKRVHSLFSIQRHVEKIQNLYEATLKARA